MDCVLFRVDASITIGTGHVMRCLIIADELKSQGYRCLFISRRLDGNAGAYVQERGFQLEWVEELSDPLPTGWEEDACATIDIVKQLADYSIEWLIVDHYGIDKKWEATLAGYVNRIMVIDDLANRPHHCSLLLDQNVRENYDNIAYRDLVPADCKLLLGPRYLLLRASFYEERRVLRTRNGTISRLLMFFGGSDPSRETIKALTALSNLERRDFVSDVIIGATNPDREEIMRLCEGIEGTNLQIQVENMAEIIASADFALGAGGVAMWERCYLGLPSVVTIVADNQTNSIDIAARAGALWNLGYHKYTTSDSYRNILIQAMVSPEDLIMMSHKAIDLVESRSSGMGNPILEAMSSQIDSLYTNNKTFKQYE